MQKCWILWAAVGDNVSCVLKVLSLHDDVVWAIANWVTNLIEILILTLRVLASILQNIHTAPVF